VVLLQDPEPFSGAHRDRPTSPTFAVGVKTTVSRTCTNLSASLSATSFVPRSLGPNYRRVMRRRWRDWDVISETTPFAVAE
jgi:hypothetical protein